MRTYLNDGWQFYTSKQDFETDKNGQAVRLPHTNVETPFNCFDEKVYQFESYYTRSLTVNKDYEKHILTFEGAAHFAEVFVNGKSVATHNCGYTAFSVDITDFLAEGENKLTVRLDSRESLNQPPFGFVIDYLTYGGLYREVYLDEYNNAFVSDAFVNAEPDKPVRVGIALSNFSAPCEISAEIFDGQTKVFGKSYTAQRDIFTFSEPLDLKLWSIDSPCVYTLKLTVEQNEYQTTFGVRKAVFTEDGFFLNGKKVKIVGLNRHQSFPYVGYAMPESMQRRDAQILKNTLCVNAVRTSHYPQSQYFLDECDKLGLLVFTEIPGWQHIGDESWKEIALKNVEEMVLQNRNHPSVVLWGVRINESLDCDELYEKTNALAHKLDPTRQTGGVRYLTHSHLLEDVYTFNDFNRAGATNRKNICPQNAPYIVSEYNGHMYPTKSYDDFPHQRQHVLRYAKMLDDVFAADGTCGAFGWCMFDYNTHMDFGSGDRICYHGVTDMFRNPKMAAGVFSAMGKKPFLDVCFTTDIGDYPESNIEEMYCLTNVDAVQLFKGETLIKTYTHADSPFKSMPNPPILIDDLIGNRLTDEDGIKPKYARLIKLVLADLRKYGVSSMPMKTKLKIARIMVGAKLSMDFLVKLYRKYESNWGSEAASLTLVGIKDGLVVARKTVGYPQAVELKITPSTLVLKEKTTYDVAAVNIVAVDQNGNVLPYIVQNLHFEATGAVELIGPADLPLCGGRSGTFVKTKGVKGKGALTINGKKVEFDVQ